MEILLNLAWALCSLGLVWFWLRLCASGSASHRIPVHTQLLALAMIVLLLLPVISLSDDLMAMQGAAETDACLRRALHIDELHPSIVPIALGVQERELSVLLLGVVSRFTSSDDRAAIAPLFVSPSVDSRPPPRVQA